jgi:hypothetical protein
LYKYELGRVNDDEMLLLPEVFSTLSVDKVKRDFAAPGVAAEEAELRNSRWWGRLYIDGWPQTVQYLRAHFGEPPPTGLRRVVVSDPIDGCSPLKYDDDPDKYAGAIGEESVLASGECTCPSCIVDGSISTGSNFC